VLEISWDVHSTYSTREYPFSDKDDGKRFLQAKIGCDCASVWQHRNKSCEFEARCGADWNMVGCPSCGETRPLWPTKWRDDGQRSDPGLLTREAITAGWIRARQVIRLSAELRRQVCRESFRAKPGRC
jgi:hypothetical protein